jgi:hypothetical protein
MELPSRCLLNGDTRFKRSFSLGHRAAFATIPAT